MNIRVGHDTFEFYKKPDIPRILDFGSQDEALRWLKGLRDRHADAIVRLQEYAARSAEDPDFARLTEQQTLERLAMMLYYRRIVVLAREQRATAATPAERTESSPPPFPFAKRDRRAQTSSTPAPQPKDPTTFEGNLDAAALASTLVAAAANGSPFCQECTRAAGASTSGQ